MKVTVNRVAILEAVRRLRKARRTGARVSSFDIRDEAAAILGEPPEAKQTGDDLRFIGQYVRREIGNLTRAGCIAHEVNAVGDYRLTPKGHAVLNTHYERLPTPF